MTAVRQVIPAFGAGDPSSNLGGAINTNVWNKLGQFPEISLYIRRRKEVPWEKTHGTYTGWTNNTSKRSKTSKTSPGTSQPTKNTSSNSYETANSEKPSRKDKNESSAKPDVTA